MSEDINVRDLCFGQHEGKLEMIPKIQQAFRDETMDTTLIKEWYDCFKTDRTSVESEA